MNFFLIQVEIKKRKKEVEKLDKMLALARFELRRLVLKKHNYIINGKER